MTVIADGTRQDTGWRTVLLDMLVGARAAAQRFPVTTLFLLAAAVQANMLIAEIHPLGETDGRPGELNFFLVIGLIAGASASLAVALSGEARGHSGRAKVVAALLGGAAASTLVTFSEATLALQWVLVPGFFGLVPVAPFIGRGGGSSFWMFTARTAFAVLLGLFALLLFAGGISGILASLTYLFGLPVPEELYAHVWAFTSLFAAPLFGLGQLPDRFDEEPGTAVRGFMDRGMRALGDFVAAPLLILYAVILHVYAAKIAVTGEVPQGQIGWLVLTYGFCLFGTLLVIKPFFDRARAPTQAFLRLWPLFLPVPLVLLFYALALRVGEFGFTPERYLLGLFGLVTVLAVVLQFLPRLKGDIRAIAALPAFALILGGFGPQGALGVSIESQAARFLAIVKESPVEGDRHTEALGALRFLEGHDALARVAPEGVTVATDGAQSGYRNVAEAWGLDPDRLGPDRRGFPLNSRSEPTAFPAAGFDVLVQAVRLSTGTDQPLSVRLPSGREAAFTLRSDSLEVTVDGESTRFPVVAEQIEALSKLDVDAPAELRLEADGRALLLIPSFLAAGPESPPSLQSLEGTILLRAEDWL